MKLQSDLRYLLEKVCSLLGWTGLILHEQPGSPVTRKPARTLPHGTQCSCPSTGHALHSGPGHGHPGPAGLLFLSSQVHFERRGSVSLRLAFPMSST